MDLEVTALDHIYVTVKDLGASEAFYDPVMRFLDFRKGTTPIGGEPHLHYFNRVLQLTLRPARHDRPTDPYAPGSVHHLCFRVPGRREVDAAARGLRELGVAATEPRLYPEYAPDYYATFFEDPDGIRLELVAERELRRTVREHWDRLTAFEDPVRKAGLLA